MFLQDHGETHKSTQILNGVKRVQDKKIHRRWALNCKLFSSVAAVTIAAILAAYPSKRFPPYITNVLGIN